MKNIDKWMTLKLEPKRLIINVIGGVGHACGVYDFKKPRFRLFLPLPENAFEKVQY